MADKKTARKEYKPGRQCQKCGCRLAQHKNRVSCGRCGYTEFIGHGEKV
jgi:ribosomal protein S27AE